MKDKESIVEEVIKYRKKFFKEKLFEKYNDILDKMQIPEKFNYLDCVPDVFNSLEYEDIKQFKKDRYNLLYKEAKKYVNEKLKKISDLDNVIILVHPFYPGLRHANFLIEFQEYYKEYLEYERKIKRLLSKPENNIILFESPDNFARYTYSFMDFDSIKKVIFTEHSTGKILSDENISNLNFLKNKEIKICGCYGENCIVDVEKQLQDLKVKISREKSMILNRAIKI
ncbi:MAG TPA: hypothetical protein DDY53_01350 [Clostridiales bacterium]|jgi:hypothetical protein|nr:hypothetical protein [Clostridiales bacterium]